MLRKILAFDTETYLIEDRTTIQDGCTIEAISKSGGKTYTSPFKHPKLVLGTLSWEGHDGDVTTCPAAGDLLLGPADLVEALKKALLDPTCHIICHNAPFDAGVVTAFAPEMEELFMIAAEQDRLHDTKVLDLLYGLAVGRYDRPKFDAVTKTWSTPELKSRSLETIAFEYVGMRLQKDPEVRLGFGEYDGRLDQLPDRYRVYAMQDAIATRRIFRELERRLDEMQAKHFLSEAIQVRTELVISDMDKRGVHLDVPAAQKLARRFDDMLLPLQQELAAAGLGRWKPRPKTIKALSASNQAVLMAPEKTWIYDEPSGQLKRWRKLKDSKMVDSARPTFSLNIAALQAAVQTLGIPDIPTRDDGTPELEYDYWAPKIPATHKPLQAWLEYLKLSKILSTYLNTYRRAARGIVFPRWWALGARTGRMSASCPSLQNIPKRKYGIRALFIPTPGLKFIKGDYTAQEMYTLCQAMLDMGIQGNLYKVLSDTSVDAHIYGCSITLAKDYKAVTKLERQGQKALHFGVPGGLGAAKLADYAYQNYGVLWTVDEAKERRRRFLDAFPDIEEYLNRMKEPQEYLLLKVTGLGRFEWSRQLDLGPEDWNVIRAMTLHENPEIRALGIECERQLTIELRTGFRRGSCRFTEGANCGFQGLAAAVTKEAAWNALRAGLDVAMIVHDEVVVESEPLLLDHNEHELKHCMLGAFCKVCPDVGRFAKVELEAGLDRWGPATDRHGNLIDLETLR